MSESTEKLLHIIRGHGERGAALSTSGGSSDQVAPQRRPIPSPRVPLFSWKKRKQRCLGVDLNERGLRLALLGGVDNALLGCRQTLYPKGLALPDAAFPTFLRKEVASLCGQVDDLAIWSHVASPRVELLSLKIPKVAEWEIGDLLTWRVRKDHSFDDREYVLDFEIQGPVMDQGVSKIAVLVCLAPRKELDHIRGIFSAAGLRLAGLTVAPLAFQALLRSGSPSLPEATFALLDIANTSSRIDIYTQRQLTLSRVIKTGQASMAEALAMGCAEMGRPTKPALTGQRGVNKQSPLKEQEPFAITYDREGVERPFPFPAANGEAQIPVSDGSPHSNQSGLVSDHLTHASPAADRDQPDEALPESGTLDKDKAADLLLHKLANASVAPNTSWMELSPQTVFEMIKPACERLVRQVERTFDYAVRTLAQPRPERLLLTGELSVNNDLTAYISKELGASVQAIDPLGPGNPLCSAAAAVLSPLEQRRLDLPTALARCETDGSMNLLRTFLQRQEAKAQGRTDVAIYAAAILALLILSLFHGMGQKATRQKAEILQAMETRLTAFQPQMDETTLIQLAAEVEREQARLGDLSLSLESVALLGEISRLTPANIKILHLSLESAHREVAPSGTDADKKSGENIKPTTIILDVLLTGPVESLDTSLTGYVFALRGSRLFDMPVVHSKNLEQQHGLGEAMRVVLHLDSRRV